MLSALQSWVSLGLLYGLSPLLSALQLWVSLDLLYNLSTALYPSTSLSFVSPSSS
jgi:hypothetical protein